MTKFKKSSGNSFSFKKCKNSSDCTLYIQQLWLDKVFGIKLPPAILQNLVRTHNTPAFALSLRLVRTVLSVNPAFLSLAQSKVKFNHLRCLLKALKVYASRCWLNHGNVTILKAHT